MSDAKIQDLAAKLAKARHQLKKAQMQIATLEALLNRGDSPSFATNHAMPPQHQPTILSEHQTALGAFVELDGDVRNYPDDDFMPLHDIDTDDVLNSHSNEEREFQIYLKALHEITIELTQIDELDTFYKRAVEFGLNQLGFERFGLFLYVPEDESVFGTYGVDAEGRLIDARHVRFVPDEHGAMARAYHREDRFYFGENVPLYDDKYYVGMGWIAASVLWNGTQRLGWFVADNLLRHAPASKPALDILGLYGLTVGTLLAQKQVQLALRESEARYRHLAENAQDTIYRFRLQPESYLEYISPAVTTLVGYKPSELYENVKLSYELLFLGDSSLITEISEAQFGFNEPLVLRWRHKDGALVWVEHRAVPIYDEMGWLIAVEGIARDVTQRQRVEAELRKALAREKELNELKRRFTSMVSHEFRTPLAVIQAATDLIKHYGDRISPERQQEHLEEVHLQINHLVSLLDDILAIGRAESKGLQLSASLIDLPAFCRMLVFEIQQTTQTHVIQFESHGNKQQVVIDSNLMRRAVGNLLSNAVKYSPQGSNIIFDLTCDKHEAIFTIKDQGIGIPEGDQPDLFRPFQRASNVHEVSGTGLGLAIVKQAVDLHGGTVTVDSRIGEGTTVTIKIPI